MSWHPTLDNMERKTDRPQDRPRPLTDTARREDALRVIGTWFCWCGEQRPHDWPGKDDGKPHPRRETATSKGRWSACTVPAGSQGLRSS